MIRYRHRLPVAVVAALSWLVLLPASPAAAQSTRDLREENQRLQTEVEDLRRELDAARARIAELERELAAARAGAARGSGSAPQPQPEVTIDESEPNASPRALLRSIIESYETEFADLEPSYPDTDQRNLYLRRVERWRGGAVRQFKLPIEWTVEVLDMEQLPEGEWRLALQAVDPETGAALGDEFEVSLPNVQGRRIAALADRHELETLVLRGVAEPQIRVNPEREARGVFDNPPFIGPFAEYTLVIRVTSLAPPRPERETVRQPEQQRDPDSR